MEINIEELSLEEKIGQMLIIGMDTNYITDRIKNMIQKYKIGGIILYRKNFKSYDSMVKLINELKELNKNNKIPMFIAIDQEGGRVNRMPKELKNLPAANKVANKKDIELVKNTAQITARMLYESGFNMNFAPVMDIKRFSENHVVGDRAFGENKDDVSKYAIEYMKQLQQNNIISVIKHFPGHGATKKDSHFSLPIINKEISELQNDDMIPFKNAIDEGADAILIGHLVIKNVTGIYPASLSRKFIYKYLRKGYRYNKVIVTDDLKMRAIRLIYGPRFAFKKAFEAGNDIIVFRYNQKEEEKCYLQIVNMVKENKINIGIINRSVKRILKLKQKYKLNNNTINGIRKYWWDK